MFDIEREMRRFQDSVVGSFWAIMVFDGFGPDPFFGKEFDRGAKEVNSLVPPRQGHEQAALIVPTRSGM